MDKHGVTWVWMDWMQVNNNTIIMLILGEYEEFGSKTKKGINLFFI